MQNIVVGRPARIQEIARDCGLTFREHFIGRLPMASPLYLEVPGAQIL
jgi:AraC-like DNA-binding protein